MSKELDTAIEAAKAAGEILMQNFRKGTSAKRKTAKELVTPIDVECERKILSILQRDFSDYNIWSEEMGSQDNKSDYRWIVDPLDGTHNFFFGLPIFGVSIALERRGEIQCGVILLPAFNELFTAEKGKGAFLNENPIHVSKRSMNESVINLCSRFFDTSERAKKIVRLASEAFNVRGFGAAVFYLSGTAVGRIDAAIDFDDRPTDFGAGWLLVKEAGGKLTKFDGKEFSIKDMGYIASNGIFHDKLVEIMEEEK